MGYTSILDTGHSCSITLTDSTNNQFEVNVVQGETDNFDWKGVFKIIALA